MGRRGDVDDVDVGPGQDLAEVRVPVDAGAGDLQGRGQVAAVDVADGAQDRAFVAEVSPAHPADADDGLGQGVARSEITGAAEHAAGDDGQRGRGGGAGPDELAAGKAAGMGHGRILSKRHSRAL